MSQDFITKGYEDMELSTQIVIKEALNRSLKVEILDREEQFISISSAKKTEYIKEATKTSYDSYITSEILGNKEVTKKILTANNIKVPQGENFSNFEVAISNWKNFENSKIVVKPKTTNYGMGITILDKNHNLELYKKALEVAFSLDKSVIVEEFAEGIECRFLVIDGKCIAVLHRVPANVLGDGESSIEELINLKNQDPRRGKGHKTPLEKIEMGSTEKDYLSLSDKDFSSVPKKDEIVFLRANSNISTGGDSIDYTDLVDSKYKDIAVLAAKAVNSKICGVDMIAVNFAEFSKYSIIELNYNPVLYFHNFPYSGKNRQVEKSLFDLLNF